MNRNVQSKLLGWRARVRKGSKYDKHTYLNPDRKEFKTKGEVSTTGARTHGQTGR